MDGKPIFIPGDESGVNKKEFEELKVERIAEKLFGMLVSVMNPKLTEIMKNL